MKYRTVRTPTKYIQDPGEVRCGISAKKTSTGASVFRSKRLVPVPLCSGAGREQAAVAAGQEGAGLQPAGGHSPRPLRVRRPYQPGRLAHQDGGRPYGRPPGRLYHRGHTEWQWIHTEMSWIRNTALYGIINCLLCASRRLRRARRRWRRTRVWTGPPPSLGSSWSSGTSCTRYSPIQVSL
jgi:hypothetical protein